MYESGWKTLTLERVVGVVLRHTGAQISVVENNISLRIVKIRIKEAEISDENHTVDVFRNRWTIIFSYVFFNYRNIFLDKNLENYQPFYNVNISLFY